MEARAALACRFDSPAPETTAELAALLGRSIGARGLAIGLVGPLGAGKTLFVKGLASGLGVDPRVVSSPTFVIAQQYPVPEGPEALHHLDLYRVESEAELESIGFLDLLGPAQVLAVEWLDRFPDILGPDRLEIELAPPRPAEAESASGQAGEGPSTEGPGDAEAVFFDSGRRTLRATAYGDEAVRVLRDWAERWERLDAEGDIGSGDEAAGNAGDGGVLSEVAKLVVVLALAGLYGGRALLGLPEPAPACNRLVAGDVDALAGGADDGLGDVAVACGAPLESGEPERTLTGMAQLLAGGRIDPNEAPQGLLENLPGIGPERARAILEARERRAFDSLRAIERVPGIGPRTREQLEPFLAVDPGPARG